MYSVLDVARYIIKYCNEKNYSISNLKLQKILYFVQAAFLVDKDKPCFGEKIEAWDFGPVVPDAYHRYKMFGNSNIILLNNTAALIDNISATDKKLINDMVDQCSEYTPSQLVTITHNQRPWMDAYSPYMNNEIKNVAIKSFFEEE